MSLSLNFLTLGLYMDMRHWCMKYPNKRGRPPVDEVLSDSKDSVFYGAQF